MQYPTSFVVPLFCVPTSYVHLQFEALETANFNGPKDANHLLRSAYLAMKDVANHIIY